jgi:hypothetical protein
VGSGPFIDLSYRREKKRVLTEYFRFRLWIFLFTMFCNYLFELRLGIFGFFLKQMALKEI